MHEIWYRDIVKILFTPDREKSYDLFIYILTMNIQGANNLVYTGIVGKYLQG